jgi:mono/diheme cytochrome c family protein
MMLRVKGWLLTLLLLAACRPADMYDQQKYPYYQSNPFFPDQRAARQPVPGTVGRDSALNSPWRELDLDPNRNVPPFPLNRPELERGRERYEIHCIPCHGWTGEGNGMIVQRGFVQPPPFTSNLIREKPLAHYVRVISEGWGAMPSYAAQIPLRDRWLIAVYVRVLQESRSVPVSTVSEEARKKLEEEIR